MHRESLVLPLLAGLPAPARARGVTARLEDALATVQGALGETFARALPLPSASIFVPAKAAAIQVSHLRVSASVHSFLFAGTYGITDELGRRFASQGYVFLEPFDMFSSVYVRRAIAPGVAARGLRRVRAALGR